MTPSDGGVHTIDNGREILYGRCPGVKPRFNELLKAARAEFDENKARDMYWEMQQIIHDDGGVVIPAFVDHLLAHSEKLGHGEIAGNWEMDGYRLIERWWFA